MSDRLTIKSKNLGRTLRDARKSLGLSGTDFCAEIAAIGGTSLKPPQLSFVENGTRGLRLDDWRSISAALVILGAAPDLVATLDAGLPSINVEPTISRSLQETVSDLRRSLDQLMRQSAPVIEQTDGMKSDRGASAAAYLTRYLPITQRAQSILGRSDIGAIHSDSRDRALVRKIEPAESRIPVNQLFDVTVELENAGFVAWRRRLLLRLGPPITSTITQTAPLLPVPDTPPGATCRIQIPGRAHFLPGSCVVTYVMIFPDGTPCLPGGFVLPITSIGQPHRALEISAKVGRILRSLSRK